MKTKKVMGFCILFFVFFAGNAFSQTDVNISRFSGNGTSERPYRYTFSRDKVEVQVSPGLISWEVTFRNNNTYPIFVKCKFTTIDDNDWYFIVRLRSRGSVSDDNKLMAPRVIGIKSVGIFSRQATNLEMLNVVNPSDLTDKSW